MSNTRQRKNNTQRFNTRARNNTNKANGKRPPRSGGGGSFAKIPSLTGPAYTGQAIVLDKLLGTTSLLVTNALGTLATALTLGNLNLNVNVPAFTTKWGNIYDEYVILGVDVRIVPVNNNSSGGVSAFWFDEKTATVPVLADTQVRTVRYIQNAFGGQKQFNMKWRARDLNDLVYVPITTDTTPIFFKIYTNAANFAAAANQALFMIHQTYHVSFRGYRT
jgi:hypothetical protein